MFFKIHANASFAMYQNSEDNYNPDTQNFQIYNQEHHNETFQDGHYFSQKDGQIQNYLPSYKHNNYTKFEEDTPIPQVPDIKSFHKRATESEIEKVKQQYRHVNLTNKLPRDDYFSINFRYGSPTFMIKNFASRLSAGSDKERAAIAKFSAKYLEAHKSNDITFNGRNVGLSLNFGKRIAYDALSEWEFFIFQGQFVAGLDMKDDDGSFQFEANDTSFSHRNVEYLHRMVGVHYNLIKEFRTTFEKSQIMPYVFGGLGTTTQWGTLRFDGNGAVNVLSGNYTRQQFFSFYPSFNLGAGFRYKTKSNISVDVKLSTVQAFNDINMKNYFFNIGIVISH